MDSTFDGGSSNLDGSVRLDTYEDVLNLRNRTRVRLCTPCRTKMHVRAEGLLCSGRCPPRHSRGLSPSLCPERGARWDTGPSGHWVIREVAPMCISTPYRMKMHARAEGLFCSGWCLTVPVFVSSVLQRGVGPSEHRAVFGTEVHMNTNHHRETINRWQRRSGQDLRALRKLFPWRVGLAPVAHQHTPGIANTRWNRVQIANVRNLRIMKVDSDARSLPCAPEVWNVIPGEDSRNAGTDRRSRR